MKSIFSGERNSGNVYAVMLDDLMSNLRSGNLRAGDRLPSEKELAAAYEISVNSVRRGIDELRKEGIIRSRRGSGMFVTSPENQPRHDSNLDTVAVLFDTYIRGYHPYFSELRKGVNESLIQKGWRLWIPENEITDNAENGDERVMYHNLKSRISQFHRRGEFAGAALSPAHAKQVSSQIGYDLPIVLPTYSERFSFVAYNWDDELVQITRSVLRKGAENILFVLTGDRKDFDLILKQAVMAEKRNSPPRFAVLQLPVMQNYFMLSKEACSVTEQYLHKERAFDAVIIDSDFAAQGVMDAFINNPQKHTESIHFALMKNKFFKLNTPFHYSASIIDGYIQGIKMGNLLHEKIISPETAPVNSWLRGDVTEGGCWKV